VFWSIHSFPETRGGCLVPPPFTPLYGTLPEIKWRYQNRIEEVFKQIDDAEEFLAVALLKAAVNSKIMKTQFSAIKKVEERLENTIRDLTRIRDYRPGRPAPFAKQYADYAVSSLNLLATALEQKARPARTAAETVRGVKEDLRTCVEEKRQLIYELEFIRETFPELYSSIDLSPEPVTPEYDAEERPGWVNEEDWAQLTSGQRRDVYLERYLERQDKKNWQIGRDYEMYVGYTYEQKGYSVEFVGIEKRLQDLGRDLICRRGNEVLIVQCKRWAQAKEIRENAIAQLYGTTILYKLENEVINVVPVLVTTTMLSSMAKRFASELGVRVHEETPIGRYPPVKCNINNGERIYHIPTDQQYDRTVIREPGETYAWTCVEAENRGFRPAYRFRGE
jgi:hypothetical protein